MARTMTPKEFADKLDRLVRTGEIGNVLMRVGHRLTNDMKTDAKLNVTGKVLNVRTGKLRQSIDLHSGIRKTKRGVRSFVGAGGRRAFYAKFHERGKRQFLAPARAKVIKTAPDILKQETIKAFRTVGIGS